MAMKLKRTLSSRMGPSRMKEPRTMHRAVSRSSLFFQKKNLFSEAGVTPLNKRHPDSSGTIRPVIKSGGQSPAQEKTKRISPANPCAPVHR